jgi:hypothetical protein
MRARTCIDPSRRLVPSTVPEDHPIHDAAEAGELARVRAFLDQQPSLVHNINRAGGHPLHRAVFGGSRWRDRPAPSPFADLRGDFIGAETGTGREGQGWRDYAGERDRGRNPARTDLVIVGEIDGLGDEPAAGVVAFANPRSGTFTVFSAVNHTRRCPNSGGTVLGTVGVTTVPILANSPRQMEAQRPAPLRCFTREIGGCQRRPKI